MKFAIGDDVGQVKVITTTRGIDTSVQTSARAKIVSFLEPNRNAAIQAMQVLRFRGRDGIIAAASKGGLIRFLDPTVSPLAPADQQVLHTHQLPGGTDTDIIGLGLTASGILYAATSTGHIEFLTRFAGADDEIAVSAHDFAGGGDFSAVGIHGGAPHSAGVPRAVALGGKDRDVEIWESSVSDGDGGSGGGKPTWRSVWKAKNVKPTKLGLEVPVWVSNIIFLPCSPPPPPPPSAVPAGKGAQRHAPATTEAYRLAVSTHHSHLRLYDTAVSRRPVFTETLSRTPILTLRLHPSTPADAGSPLTSARESPETATTLQALHFVYSDKHGHFGLHSTATRRSLGIYKGSTGAVLATTTTAATTAAEGGAALVAGVGFDRYLWVYEGDEREVVSKVYVKTKGTAVVVLDAEDEVVAAVPEKKEAEVWDELEEVGDGGGDLGGKKGKGEGRGKRGAEEEGKERGDDYTEALVTIKRKKMSRPRGGDKKRRIV